MKKAEFEVGDNPFYISGDKFHDQLSIASVQRGKIEYTLHNEYVVIDGVIYSMSCCFRTLEDAMEALIEVMSRKIENLQRVVDEFRSYKEAVEAKLHWLKDDRRGFC